ncbi:MIP family channel protein [Nitratireductor sp. ZSWI3]|uniref:MIP family channel protein n=1 Tax=Nitratireductor sp. ZSWI3 TaxID=2966359 RepID=UPI00214FAEAE|nr:MIP family channel protein [Nitratireductor sp. ZSWI3]MCR4265087.1 MIP family channel protein [Nitratireductor sp. ZSWI3]
MKAYVAEVFGTFCLVFFGCASVVTGGYGGLLPAGGVGIALSFGIAVIAMAYAIGPVSGAHLNPAVTLGAFLSGRMPAKDVVPYWVAQVAGGILGAAVLWIIASGNAAGAPPVLAANGWDAAGGYSMPSAFIAEAVATFIFVTVILGVTSKKHETSFAGLVIGLTLTVIHLCLIPVTGTSVNPARSIGPALFSGSTAIGQLWLFILAPLLGAAAAGLVAKARIFEKD